MTRLAVGWLIVLVLTGSAICAPVKTEHYVYVVTGNLVLGTPKERLATACKLLKTMAARHFGREKPDWDTRSEFVMLREIVCSPAN